MDASRSDRVLASACLPEPHLSPLCLSTAACTTPKDPAMSTMLASPERMLGGVQHGIAI